MVEVKFTNFAALYFETHCPLYNVFFDKRFAWA